ncbi:MAG TPA: metallophosphoesterase [Gemmatimonadales bacterium]
MALARPVPKILLPALLLAAACAHRAPPPAVPPIPSGDIVTSIFLLGDAGTAGLDPDPNLMELSRQAAESPKGSVIVFLGDNLYPAGMPPEDDPTRVESERRLEVELDVARYSQRRAIFVAGNHDWQRWGSGGLGAIGRVSDYLRERVKGLSIQLPDSACPGPVTVDVGTAVRLVFLDTQWWLHNHDKPYGTTSRCSAINEDQVIEQLKATLASAGKRHVVVAAHHPLATGGEHGGRYGLGRHLFPLRGWKRWLWIPIPVLGSIYPVARKLGITSQDLSNGRNEYMRRRLGEAFAEHPPLLYAAGHDHNLQVFKGPYARYSIVSGSGVVDHQEGVGWKKETIYAEAAPGFMRLDVDRQGRARLSVTKTEATGPSESMAIWLTEP